MTNVLENILEIRKESVQKKKDEVPVLDLETRARRTPLRSLLSALVKEEEIGIVAEMKRKSPSAGSLKEPYDVAEIALAYEKGGAHALSVLTEPVFFGGDITDVAKVREVSRLPILRKDFVFDPYQIIEAKAYGADAVLLIADMLSSHQLRDLVQTAKNYQIETLVEVFSSEALPVALNAGSALLGINTRNLRTLEMKPDNIALLSRLIPRDRFIVAESGIKTRDDIEKLKSLRIAGALVGESLLRQPDLQSAVNELVQAGKRSVPNES